MYKCTLGMGPSIMSAFSVYPQLFGLQVSGRTDLVVTVQLEHLIGSVRFIRVFE